MAIRYRHLRDCEFLNRITPAVEVTESVPLVSDRSHGAFLCRGKAKNATCVKFVSMPMLRFADIIEYSKETREHELKQARINLNDDGFIGRFFSSWDQVYAALNEPWKPGIAAIETLRAKLERDVQIRPQSRKRVARWDETDGHEMDWDRLQSGQPFWRRCHRQTASGIQHVDIKVNIAVPYYVDSNDVFWPMAAATVLSDRLEEAGYAVRIIAMDAMDSVFTDGTGLSIGILAKDYDEPLAVSSLATLFAGWTYRTIFFRWLAGGFGVYTANDFMGYTGPLNVYPLMDDIIATHNTGIVAVYDSVAMKQEFGKPGGFSREVAEWWLEGQIEMIEEQQQR
ncbi:MAG TPA: hypothetical protein PLK04_11210 [Bacillota bacterium]|mgnify:CR=1 FL=1|nr:hypothetical protein [Bacillota bacterium]HPZ14784.1 hypothetical protein [Bacillota bacterium]